MTRPSRATRVALLQFTITVASLGALEIAVFRLAPGEPRWPVVLYGVVGLTYLTAGLLAWIRRPGNGTGTLLSVSGLILLLGATEHAQPPVFRAIGLLVSDLPLGVMLHLLLAFPSGRLHDRQSRWLVAAGYVLSVVPNTVVVLWSTDPTEPNAIHLGTSQVAVDVAHWSQNLVGTTVIALSIVVLVGRLRRAEPVARRALRVVYGCSALACAGLVVSTTVVGPLLHLTPLELFRLQIIPVVLVPIGFVAGLVQGGFAPTRELDELVAWLGSTSPDRPSLLESLRFTLGDPSLDLLFWLRDGDRYVTEDGSAVQLPEAGSGRAAVEVVTATGKVAAISYDATLVADPELVRSVGRVVALQLEGDRLTADLLASREALRESRSRLVESTDRERRRIARDLHDGLQGRLVVLALRAGQMASDVDASDPHAAQVTALRDDLETAIVELRDLVHGVLPELLIQRGLPAAVEELLDQTPIRSRLDVTDGERRLPHQVETAGYFVVAEGLANVTKHARAHTVSVVLAQGADLLRVEVRDDGVGGASLAGGTGLHGLVDRVEALGGRVRIESPAGRGTSLLAEVPCES